jgi:hypothetical protein
MTTVALEGTGAAIAFSTSGFTADLITLTMSDRARETIETTHLGSGGTKTYKPGEIVDRGSITVIVDHNPAELNLLGYGVEPIALTYPSQDGITEAARLDLFGIVTRQGAQQMQMDGRMVTKLLIQLTNNQTDQVTVTPTPPPSIYYDDLLWESTNTATSPISAIATSKYIIPRSLPGFTKYYFEVSGAGTNNSQGLLQIGIRDLGTAAFTGTYVGQSAVEYAVQLLSTSGINKYNNGVSSLISAQSGGSGVRIGFYVDPIAGTIGIISPNGSDLGVIYTVATGLRNAVITMSNSSVSGGAPNVTATVYQDPTTFLLSPPSGYLPIQRQTLTSLSTVQVSSLNATGILFGGGATYAAGVYEVHYTGVGGWNVGGGAAGYYFQTCAFQFTGSAAHYVSALKSDGAFPNGYSSLAAMQAVGFKNRAIISLGVASTIKAYLLDSTYGDNSDQGGGAQFTLHLLT